MIAANNSEGHFEREKSEKEMLDQFLNTRTPESFEPLVQIHMEKVRRVIYRIVLNLEDADDIVQETFIRVYEKIDTFKGTSKFTTWLCQIGVNLAISFLRQKKHTQPLYTNLEGQKVYRPDREAESNEELKRIHRAITQLSEGLRAVIVLNVIEGMEIEEISKILRCVKATVYWRLHQARKILARKLEVNNE